MNRVTLPNTPFESVFNRINAKNGAPNQPISECATWLGSSEFTSGARTALEAANEFQYARRCIQIAKDRMKAIHDKKGIATHCYNTGDKVWLSMKDVSLRHPSQRGKMVPRFIGPMDVIKMVGRNAVQLNLPSTLKIHSTVSVAKIKPFFARQNQIIPPVIIDDQEEFELESISDHFYDPDHSISLSKRASTLKFKAVWKGSYEDSWHAFDNFENAKKLMCKYLNSCTPSIRKTIFKLIGHSAVSQLGDSKFNSESKKLGKDIDEDD